MLNQIKVGGITYDVHHVDLTTHRDEELGMQLGYCHFHNDLIETNSKISEQRKNQTLIHEMMHAMYEEAGLEQNEEEVDALAKVLFQVLQDNDFSWLKRHKQIYLDGKSALDSLVYPEYQPKINK